MICIDIQSSDQETTSKEALGGPTYYYQCDITAREQVERTIATIEKEVGDISMLFHCCSLPSPRSVVTNPPSVKQTMDVSVTSYFYVSLSSSDDALVNFHRIIDSPSYQRETFCFVSHLPDTNALD